MKYLDELLEFPEPLESVELIINGDAFGLWELTGYEGIAKFGDLQIDFVQERPIWCEIGDYVVHFEHGHQ